MYFVRLFLEGEFVIGIEGKELEKLWSWVYYSSDWIDILVEE